jgi:hypothetical protein
VAAGRSSSTVKTDDTKSQPSFALAIVAVLVAGFATSYLAMLFIGFTPYLGRNTWYLLTSLVGAVALRILLRAIGYEIPYLAAFFALLIGSLISLGLARWIPAATGPTAPYLPAFGLVAAIPSLLLSAWIVQLTASKGGRDALS